MSITSIGQSTSTVTMVHSGNVAESLFIVATVAVVVVALVVRAYRR